MQSIFLPFIHFDDREKTNFHKNFQYCFWQMVSCKLECKKYWFWNSCFISLWNYERWKYVFEKEINKSRWGQRMLSGKFYFFVALWSKHGNRVNFLIFKNALFYLWYSIKDRNLDFFALKKIFIIQLWIIQILSNIFWILNFQLNINN